MESTATRPPGPAPVRLFRKYNRTIGAAYAVLLSGLAGFFVWQLTVSLRDEVAFIRGQLDRHAQFLEFVLRSSADQIESLRMTAGAAHASGRACDAARAGVARGELRSGQGQFDREGLRQRDLGGNLVGQGAALGRDEAFYCAIGAVLALDPLLHAMAFQLPHVARARFLGEAQFRMEFPWRPSSQLPFDLALRQDPAWRLSQPAANPDRLKVWAPPYFGGEDAGLLAPISAPVYGGDRFLGVLAVDMSLDYLNRVNGNFGYALGTVSVVDAHGHVLAHPRLFADPLALRAPPPLGQALDPRLLPSMQALAGLPAGEPVHRAGWILIQQPFVSAPWHLVYAVPQADLWRKLLAERAPGMAAALLALALIMAVSYLVTSREFVRPAARLVEHVAAESSLASRPIPPVPPAWRPWFDAISRAFRESLQLGSLRREIDIAARLQQDILPRHWPMDVRYSLWGSMQPAKDIGGDFYDHFPLQDGRRGIVVADVSGKGVSAGLFGMVSKTLLRLLATQRLLPPGLVLAEANDALCVDNDTAMFVTAFYGQYDPTTGELLYANAGHPPPLLVRPDGQCQWLARAQAPAMGVVESVPYPMQSIVLQPGDCVVMFTDGVSEAMDPSGREFGLDRLIEAFQAQGAPAGAREVVERVQKAVAAFASGAELADDLTCVALQCHGHGLAEGVA
jgi:sigma-B regulation protein RsbU (phosphoserine phosphatase)